MPQPNENDLKQRLQDIEAELNQPGDVPSSPKVTVESPRSPIPKEMHLGAITSSVISWFRGLGSTGKIVAGVVGIFGLLTLLKVTVTLVSTVVSLVALGVIGYLAYRVLIAPEADDV
ncbi:MAG: hypothetical protein ACFCBU_10445 [Cyanophyceae cyanobacterium]